ncbi:MAG: RluA family pseudouridine synthase, partial [Chloroflexota bacterium]|nr:RluA family pseudouridine synthase [Chloroflexota bacterium]
MNAVADRVVEGRAPAGRVDVAVASVAEISRAHAQRLIGDGRALVDGARRRASDRLVGGELIRVELSAPPDESLEPESIPLRVAYEDDTMLIVDKPAGLVVHPSAGHGRGTLVNALLGRARDRGEPLGSIAGVGRPGIVHRLDKETSGLLVVAKTDAAQASLMRQFGERTIDKGYLALVRGTAPAPRGRVEAPIGRDPRDRQRMA